MISPLTYYGLLMTAGAGLFHIDMQTNSSVPSSTFKIFNLAYTVKKVLINKSCKPIFFT